MWEVSALPIRLQVLPGTVLSAHKLQNLKWKFETVGIHYTRNCEVWNFAKSAQKSAKMCNIRPAGPCPSAHKLQNLKQFFFISRHTWRKNEHSKNFAKAARKSTKILYICPALLPPEHSGDIYEFYNAIFRGGGGSRP